MIVNFLSRSNVTLGELELITQRLPVRILLFFNIKLQTVVQTISCAATLVHGYTPRRRSMLARSMLMLMTSSVLMRITPNFKHGPSARAAE